MESSTPSPPTVDVQVMKRGSILSKMQKIKRHILPKMQKIKFCASVTKDEIYNSLNSIDNDKSPEVD